MTEREETTTQEPTGEAQADLEVNDEQAEEVKGGNGWHTGDKSPEGGHTWHGADKGPQGGNHWG